MNGKGATTMSKITTLLAGIVLILLGIHFITTSNYWGIAFIFQGTTVGIGAIIEKRIGWLK